MNLRKGDEVRRQRANLKKLLKAGHVKLPDVLRGDREYLATMQLRDLLLATPMLGKIRTERALKVNQISPHARVENVTARQRERLLDWLAERCPRSLR